MKSWDLPAVVAVTVICWATCPPAGAATIQTFGEGSAVTSIDLSSTFDDLDFAGNSKELSNYASGGLAVTTNGNSYYGDTATGLILSAGLYLNPFHLTSAPPPNYSYAGVGGGYYLPYDGDLGNTDWITIAAANQSRIYGVEFLYGNAWTTGQTSGPFPWGNSSSFLQWETRRGGTTVSADQLSFLAVGTVIGFADPDGFDQLIVRCTNQNSLAPNLLQELALDNLNVQTTPEPSSLLVLAAGLLGLWGAGRRR